MVLLDIGYVATNLAKILFPTYVEVLHMMSE